MFLHPYTPWEGIHNNTSGGEEDNSSTRGEDTAKYHSNEKEIIMKKWRSSMYKIAYQTPNSLEDEEKTLEQKKKVGLIDDDLMDGWWRTRP